MISTTTSAILLVDGYNIIGTWNWLKEIRDQNGLEQARLSLIENLVNYIGYKGLQAKVVFDSQYQKTPHKEEKYTHNLSVHYTAYTETADTFIERYCASFSRKNIDRKSRVIVATSDQAQRHTVVGYGAEWLSAQCLAKEIDSTKIKEKHNHRPRKRNQGRFLINSLDTKTQNALMEMRFGLIK